jgi:glycosyltransferase involved in cell wall biosynthesis
MVSAHESLAAMSGITRFSIVTPSFNKAPYVAETIESVLSQEGNFEIEYFVMDGGSTDGSVDIVRTYADQVASGDWATRCQRILMEWVSQPDRGQSDAVNRGLRLATGDILSYINSDDLYCPGAFQRVADEFSRHPDVDFVYGDGDVIDESGRLQWEWLSRPYSHSVMTSYHFLWNDFTNYIMQQATFWRSGVLDEIGYFDEALHCAMDVEYWIRAGCDGLKLHHISHKLGKFRMIEGTKSLSSPTVFWEDQLELYRRYRGSNALAMYFAYYYYNLARQQELDVDRAIEEGRRVFSRWRQLPASEQQIIARQADRGQALARLLVANELRRRQRNKEAAIVFRKALTPRSHLILHPFALMYLLRSVSGTRVSSILDRSIKQLIHAYRSIRYDYRYLARKRLNREPKR